MADGGQEEKRVARMAAILGVTGRRHPGGITRGGE
jgi:hypothetical protein